MKRREERGVEHRQIQRERRRQKIKQDLHR